jgi:hypothetical protein
MKVKILSVKDVGIVNEERIILEVTEECNIGKYLIAITHYVSGDNSISVVQKGSYFFPNLQVKKGDWVVLYTKNGTESEKKNSDGTTSYFYFWGLSAENLTKENDCFVLIEVNTWKTVIRKK